MTVVVKPERRLFSVAHGEYIEDSHGSARDCFPIRLKGSRAEIVAHLRKDHGFGVALAKNFEFSLDYLVAGNPDGKFTAEQTTKLISRFGLMMIAAFERDR